MGNRVNWYRVILEGSGHCVKIREYFLKKINLGIGSILGILPNEGNFGDISNRVG